MSAINNISYYEEDVVIVTLYNLMQHYFLLKSNKYKFKK